MLRAAVLGSGPRFGAVGRYKVLRSFCRQDGVRGNPIVIPDRSAPPTVGVPSRIVWMTETLGPRPPAAAALLVSFGSRPVIDLAPAGFAGCRMWVDPSPSNLWSLTPAPGSMLTLEGGRLWLHWTPPPALAGQELVLQPLFAVPPGRWLWAPAVQVWVGAGPTN